MARHPLTNAFFEWHARRISAPRVTRIAEAFARRIGKADSLLDVGAGDGATAATTAALVGASRVLGVDVLVQPRAAISIAPYDGDTLPFPDGEFDVVLLSDVLHHAQDPARVLGEALRVARRAVALKDHFRFGPLSAAVLYAMDRVGNAASGVSSPGTYFSKAEWIDLVRSAGGRIESIEWPLRIHDAPFRYVTRDEYQFAAAVVRRDPT